jgi:hypothetical protein
MRSALLAGCGADWIKSCCFGSKNSSLAMGLEFGVDGAGKGLGGALVLLE